LRARHLSIRTERPYVYWVRWFVRHFERRHPCEMGGAEVAALLSDLANRRAASASTREQALAALLFLSKQGLGADLPRMQGIGRPHTPRRLPVVPSRAEVERPLAAVEGVHRLVFRLLYGTGMRKMECLRLRVKDVDFERAGACCSSARQRVADSIFL
jgi:integrase